MVDVTIQPRGNDPHYSPLVMRGFYLYNVVMSDTDKTLDKQLSGIKRYQWPKGVSGNPKGRPKGKLSPKDTIRKMFEKSPEDFEDFLTKYLNDPSNRKHVVEMLDGKPKESVDATIHTPKPIDDVSPHNSDQEDKEADEEN